MTSYSTNLSNSQWQIISKYLDTARNSKYDLREIVNALLYLTKTGCQWRLLPSDFPKWQLVYYYFSVWKKQEVIELIHENLVELIRKKENKSEEPTVGIIDAQSVKSTLVSSEARGFDAGKKIKGIKRHIIVDTLGLILAVIQSASAQDRNGAMAVVEKLVENWKRIIKIFADGGYTGKFVKKVKKQYRIIVQIIKRKQVSEFKVLPKRWMVERTFSWLDTNRRNSKNYERLTDSSVAMVHLSAIRIVINRF